MFQHLKVFVEVEELFFLLDLVGLVENNNRRHLHLLLSSTKANEVVNMKGGWWNETILFYVVRRDRLDMFKWLVKEGGHVDDKGRCGGTIAHEASFHGSNNCLRTICEHHNHLIDLKDNEGRTSLHFAVLYSQLTSVQILIELGADPNVKDNGGRTPLDMAKDEEREEMIKEFEKVSFLVCC